MARPYSMDLRERAVARVQAGESVRVIARALSISPSSAVKWAPRFRATGSAAAGKMGGHRPGTDRARGLHLAGACRRARRPRPQGGLSNRVDFRPWRRPELQKKPFCQASKTGRTSPASGRAGRPIRGGSIRGGSSSSMRPGPRPIWRRCADGGCAARGLRPRRPTAIGRR